MENKHSLLSNRREFKAPINERMKRFKELITASDKRKIPVEQTENNALCTNNGDLSRSPSLPNSSFNVQKKANVCSTIDAHSKSLVKGKGQSNAVVNKHCKKKPSNGNSEMKEEQNVRLSPRFLKSSSPSSTASTLSSCVGPINKNGQSQLIASSALKTEDQMKHDPLSALPLLVSPIVPPVPKNRHMTHISGKRNRQLSNLQKQSVDPNLTDKLHQNFDAVYGQHQSHNFNAYNLANAAQRALVRSSQQIANNYNYLCHLRNQNVHPATNRYRQLHEMVANTGICGIKPVNTSMQPNSSAPSSFPPQATKPSRKSLKKLKEETALKSYRIPKVAAASSPSTQLIEAIEKSAYNDAEGMDVVEVATSNITQPETQKMDWMRECKNQATTEVKPARPNVPDSFCSPRVSAQLTVDLTWSDLADSGDWFLVVDTNIFIHSLTFIQEIVTKKVPGRGYPVVYVPLVVIRELDALKENLHLRNPEARNGARSAINFINKCLAVHHPRIKGQTWSHYRLMEKDDKLSGESSSDDKILLSCLQLRKAVPKIVVLISNDINLRNKALIEGLDSFSVLEFEDYLSDIAMADVHKRNTERVHKRNTERLRRVLPPSSEVVETQVLPVPPRTASLEMAGQATLVSDKRVSCFTSKALTDDRKKSLLPTPSQAASDKWDKRVLTTPAQASSCERKMIVLPTPSEAESAKGDIDGRSRQEILKQEQRERALKAVKSKKEKQRKTSLMTKSRTIDNLGKAPTQAISNRKETRRKKSPIVRADKRNGPSVKKGNDTPATVHPHGVNDEKEIANFLTSSQTAGSGTESLVAPASSQAVGDGTGHVLMPAPSQTVAQVEVAPTEVDKAFQEILTTCWTVVNSELLKIRAILQSGSKSRVLEQNLTPAITVMVQLLAALKGVRLMEENGVQSASSFQQLALALSTITGVNSDTYIPIISQTSVAGKGLIVTAEEVFSALLEDFKTAKKIFSAYS